MTPPVPYNSVHATTLTKTTTELSILSKTIEQSTIQPIKRDLTTISENFEKNSTHSTTTDPSSVSKTIDQTTTQLVESDLQL